MSRNEGEEGVSDLSLLSHISIDRTASIYLNVRLKEIKGVFRNRKAKKDRLCKGQNRTQKTTDRATRTPLTTGRELLYKR